MLQIAGGGVSVPTPARLASPNRTWSRIPDAHDRAVNVAPPATYYTLARFLLHNSCSARRVDLSACAHAGKCVSAVIRSSPPFTSCPLDLGCLPCPSGIAADTREAHADVHCRLVSVLILALVRRSRGCCTLCRRFVDTTLPPLFLARTRRTRTRTRIGVHIPFACNG